MDINKTLKELKQLPGFAENVGMMLVHNGVVRGWARSDHATVEKIIITAKWDRIEEIRAEMESRPGIFKVLVDVEEGERKPGDDVLFLVVAGDIRENVKATFAELLDMVKAEGLVKQEYTE